jgi:hypothetical protein
VTWDRPRHRSPILRLWSRALSDTFAGIAPPGVPLFVLVQLAGTLFAVAAAAKGRQVKNGPRIVFRIVRERDRRTDLTGRSACAESSGNLLAGSCSDAFRECRDELLEFRLLDHRNRLAWFDPLDHALLDLRPNLALSSHEQRKNLDLATDCDALSIENLVVGEESD